MSLEPSSHDLPSPDHKPNGGFGPNNSAYKRAKLLRLGMVEEIVVELGGKVTSVDRQILIRAVELLHTRSFDQTAKIRGVNAGNRIINQLRVKYANAKSAENPFDTYVALQAAERAKP
jgi:hypothetical protein